MVLVAEVGEGELEDVQGAEEVCVELVAEVVVVLVFACAYHAVSRTAVGGGAVLIGGVLSFLFGSWFRVGLTLQ